jgi:hypothetical protein
MRIILKDLQEYDEFIKTCKYLHDFTVWKSDVRKWPKDQAGESLDFGKFPLLNTIVGLYLTTKDCPGKFDIVSLEEKRMLPPQGETNE